MRLCRANEFEPKNEFSRCFVKSLQRYFGPVFSICDDSTIQRCNNATMITFLHGKLVEALPTHVVVDVNGVGYETLIPLSSFDKLPSPGHEVKLLTQLVIREDAHTLYGFVTPDERDLFRLLVNTVSGIGPKIALNILSGISVTAFRGAVANGDVKALSQISGVGKKTAERIVVELKDKISIAGAWEAASARRGLSPSEQRINDAVLALLALGFKQVEAHDAVRRAQAAMGDQATVEDLVRACLKKGA
jgi:Holliday junction DNA helicase RuvA